MTGRSRSCGYGAESSAVPADPNSARLRRRVRHPGHRPVDGAQRAGHRSRWRGSHAPGARRPTRPAPCPAAAAPAPGRPRPARWPAPCPWARRTARARAAAPGPRTGRTGSRRSRPSGISAHQQHRPQRRRHRHRPPRAALDLPPRHHLRRHLVDRAGLPGHLIQLLLDDPEPGVISRVPAGLHPPVAAHHRRARPRPACRTPPCPRCGSAPRRPPSARSGPPPAAAGAAETAGQQPAPRRSPHPPDPAATRPGRQRHWRQTARHGTKTRGAPGTRTASATSSLTGSPSRKHVTRA